MKIDSVEKLLEWVTKQEDRYYEYMYQAMNEGNTQAYLAHQGEATAFQRVRYVIETMLEEEEDD